MNLVGRAVNRYVGRFQERLGIETTGRLAKRYNGWRYRRRQAGANAAYEERLEQLLLENEPSFSLVAKNIMEDGWAVDRTGELPWLERALAETDRIIAERGRVDRRGTALAQNDYLFYLTEFEELGQFPGLLDFATSSQVVSTVAHYMKTVPVLAQNLPSGVRIFESTDRFNSETEFSTSQLFHRDVHDSPLVYVIVLCEDVGQNQGPWSFLPTGVSERASNALGYQKKGAPYRVTDERMYRVVDPSDLVTFTGKRGDVLFLDSSRCFHYGSRCAEQPGYRIMYAYSTYCRSDFRLMLDCLRYPKRANDSELQQMILGQLGA